MRRSLDRNPLLYVGTRTSLTSTITSHQCAAMHFTSGALYHLISLCYNIIRYALRCPVSVTVGSCRDQCRTRPIDRQFSVVLASPDGAASMTRLSRLVYFWGLPWVTHSLRLRLRRGERGRRSQARPTRLMSPLPMGQETSPSATVGDGRPNHGSTLRRQSPAGGTTL